MARRRYGKPKTDVERRMTHYKISRKEAIKHPKKYPLPKRGKKFRKRR